MRKCMQKCSVNCRLFSRTLKEIIEVALWGEMRRAKLLFLKKMILIFSIIYHLNLATKRSLINTLRKYRYAITVSSKWTISLFTVIRNFLYRQMYLKDKLSGRQWGEIFVSSVQRQMAFSVIPQMHQWTRWFIWPYKTYNTGVFLCVFVFR